MLLARALAQETPYLLLDEPITGLDIRFQHEFLTLIQELCSEGVCAVCVLHDLALCDAVLPKYGYYQPRAAVCPGPP